MQDKRAAVFLDRDGVINSYVYNAEFGTIDSPSNPDQMKLLPNVGDAVALLNGMGFLVVVVSNQPGIAKGKFTVPLLDQMTEKMLIEIASQGGRLDGVYYCLHKDPSPGDPTLPCDCRKPKTGLLLRAGDELSIDLPNSYMVGDGLTDVMAGSRAGTKTVFVNSRRCYMCEELDRQRVRPDYTAPTLLKAAELIETLESKRATAARAVHLF